ncbi:MAG: Rrf2 family transcriptional regulator [Syntrophobacteraceae bacterium]
MKLSTRSRYGVRLMLDIALHSKDGPVRLGVIAERQGIPVKYLEQIIIPLKKANYVTSVRGPKGGRLLAKPPEAITVGEIVNLLEGGLRLTRCVQNPEECGRSDFCVTRFIWQETTEVIRNRLNTITFSDLIVLSGGKAVFVECTLEDGDLDEGNIDCCKQKERHT